MTRARNIDPKVHAITGYPSIGAFLAARSITGGYHVIDHGGLPIDVLVQNRGHKTTAVFLHGAVRPEYRLPMIAGLGVSRDVDVNRIFISDPSLIISSTMNLGWYAGNSKQRLQQILQDIIAKIVSSFGSEKLVFFGTSGGGFASLYYSSQFAGSLAIVANPQTNIARYEPDPVANFAATCFEVTGSDAMERLPHSVTTDLVQVYSKPVDNTVAYMQNSTDTFHINGHRDPFVENLHYSNAVFELMGDDWGDGHAAPPKALITDVLNVAASDDWAAGLKGLGFTTPNLDGMDAATSRGRRVRE
ncbi:hypothetical protein [Paenarthrobacter sp. A20]|uniref:hypothetical protein n=1 Tax=Paenarthrobacter sp. A20 TaxID=2817891 RepID=UPI00209DBC4B|nr:hypothetical protein [Paenarthrobacter sp. A20]MCP1415191.1 pimeloyl-ACP methyl ester carboxylesterase [Paenarthrobacter sp. A20]